MKGTKNQVAEYIIQWVGLGNIFWVSIVRGKRDWHSLSGRNLEV